MKLKLKYIIEFPIDTPSWNKLLGANHWQRAKIRNQIKEVAKKVLSLGLYVTKKD